MKSVEEWDDDERCRTFCAAQLRAGRLILVLGSGISEGLGLPQWQGLLDAVAVAGGSTPLRSTAFEKTAGEIESTIYGGDRERFLTSLRDELYRSAPSDLSHLRRFDLLVALGALCIPARRGHVSEVVTYNFDVMLELYLGTLGFGTVSNDRFPFWDSFCDVRVLHPHGLLRPDSDAAAARVIITEQDYQQMRAETGLRWVDALVQLWCSKTCLFIGLSGADESFLETLKLTHTRHVGIVTERHRYWGLRFSQPDDCAKQPIWEGHGVKYWTLGSYSEVPGVLFDICQRATRFVERE